MNDELLSLAAAARRHGISRATAERRLRGIAPDAETTERGQTVRRWRADTVAEAFATRPAQVELAAAFEELHRVQADMLALRRRLRAGELVRKSDFVPALAERIGVAKQRVLGLPSRLAVALAAINARGGPERAGAVRRVVTDAMADALEPLEAPFAWERR